MFLELTYPDKETVLINTDNISTIHQCKTLDLYDYKISFNGGGCTCTNITTEHYIAIRCELGIYDN